MVISSVDLRPLAWCRVAIAAVLLARTTPLLLPFGIDFLADTWPLLGWPEPGFNFQAPLVLPALLVKVLCLLRTGAAVLLLLGIWSRPAGVVAGVAGYLVISQSPFAFHFTIHLLYQAAILLGLTDSATRLALRPTQSLSPLSSYRLLRCWTASIYAWAGIYKLRLDWLDGRTLSLFHDDGRVRGWLADFLLAAPWSRAASASGVAVLELALGPLLLWPKTRRHALLVAFLFHAGLELTAHPDLIGWGMAALLLCFLELGDSRRVPPSSSRDPSPPAIDPPDQGRSASEPRLSTQSFSQA